MLQALQQICDKLGVFYPDLNNYSTDCQKSQYLINQISNFIG